MHGALGIILVRKDLSQYITQKTKIFETQQTGTNWSTDLLRNLLTFSVSKIFY